MPNSERVNLFVRKLRLCSVICDFSDGGGNDRDKEIKRQVCAKATANQRELPVPSLMPPLTVAPGSCLPVFLLVPFIFDLVLYIHRHSWSLWTT